MSGITTVLPHQKYGAVVVHVKERELPPRLLHHDEDRVHEVKDLSGDDNDNDKNASGGKWGACVVANKLILKRRIAVRLSHPQVPCCTASRSLCLTGDDDVGVGPTTKKSFYTWNNSKLTLSSPMVK